MIPLTAEQSERLGELFAQYNEVLVPYARRKLMTWRGLSLSQASSLAEDIAQETWVKVARTGAADVLLPGLTRDAILPMLYVRLQSRIIAHFQLARSTEAPVDWEDPLTRKTLCPLVPEQCAMAELPAYVRQMLAKLPDSEREALTLALDGLPNEPIGEHLGCALSSAYRLVASAVLMLKMANPSLAGPAVDAQSLPPWQREALDRMDEVRRTVLLRLDDDVRSVLLLLAQGVTCTQAAERTGLPVGQVKVVSRCLSHLRGLTASDLEQAA
ncbi:sigma factor-like helix-turn-helix DNA-binding protein [Streptomyces fagopyri]|uniref:sigma factor-like helix-turn-helix DNA-binding protein n=1 Tax=Streptomyces fagopyri TaxID=2662397 RepID=UPI00367A1C6A